MFKGILGMVAAASIGAIRELPLDARCRSVEEFKITHHRIDQIDYTPDRPIDLSQQARQAPVSR